MPAQVNPPNRAERLLAGLLPESSRAAVLGDLEERFRQLITERGVHYARLWYWREVLVNIPGFSVHALMNSQLRRQTVNGNFSLDDFMVKHQTKLAGLGFLLLIPAFLLVVPGVLLSFFGKAVEASLNSLPGFAGLVAWANQPWIVLGGLALALAVNLLAVVRFKFERSKTEYRTIITLYRNPWNLILLAIAILLAAALFAYAIGENILPLL